MRSFFLVLAGLFALAHPALPATIFVKAEGLGPAHDGSSWPTAFTTIRQGLNEAQPGDEVWVAGGSYHDTLLFARPNVALYGGFVGFEVVRRNYPVTVSYITPADPALPNVTIPPVAAGAVIDGFNLVGTGSQQSGILCQATSVTISNNEIHYFTVPAVQGGAILCDNGSAATIRNNTIDANVARDGGGICAVNATVTISSNSIGSNSAADSTNAGTDYTKEARGGGIAILGGIAHLLNNTIENNNARDGGGIWASDANVTIQYNSALSNGAEKQATTTPNTPVYNYGGGMAVQNCGATIKDNLIAGNRVYAQAPLSTGNAAFALGGGIATVGGTATIANNTVVDNTAIVSGSIGYPNYSHSIGGGIFNSASCVIAGNIFAMNEAAAFPGYGYTQNGSLDTVNSSNVRDNLFFQNSPDSTGNAYTGHDGNLLADPLFAGGGYTLSSGSIAIDHGDSAYVSTGDTDLAGAARIQGARVDIGAYEFAAPTPPGRIYVKTTGSDASSGASWSAAKRTVQAAILAVASGGEVWVSAGTYKETVTLYGAVSLFGGFAGNETTRDQRNPATHPTILDADQKGTVLTIPSTVDGATIDGFSIRFGAASWIDTATGGGILSAGRNVVIAHNTIEANSVSCVGNSPLATGGGIAIVGGGASILNNYIRNNTVSASYTGYPVFASTATAYGGGIYADSALVTIANNVVTGNMVRVSGATQPAAAGGGIYLGATAGPVSNNTVAVNGPHGIYIAGTPTGATLSNNIVTLNGTGLATQTAVPTSHNCFFGNPTADVTGMPDPTGTNGNIKADPLFVPSAMVDFHVQSLSPCRDTGDDAAAIGPTDLDGNPRILGSHVDMGAYEVATPRVYVSQTGSDGNSGATWLMAKRTVQAAIQAATPAAEVWVAEGTYAERIVVANPVTLLGGFHGNETGMSQRDSRSHPTILDGGLHMPVVSIPATASQVTLDGFTIRNGHSAAVTDMDGAGIHCQGQEIVIAHNLIEDNGLELAWDNPSRFGGGLFVDGGSVKILNNVFRRNSVSVFNTMGFPQFGNIAQALGGGAFINGAAVTVANNAFYDNSVSTGGLPSQMEAFGSAIYAEDCIGVISGNTFAGNSATASGSARWHGPAGAVFIWGAASGPALDNNIIAFNNAGLGIGGGGAVTLDRNDIYGNPEGDVNGAADPNGTNGNIKADPLFAGLAVKDLHLQSLSPCRDTGDDAAAIGPTDLDGNLRIQGAHIDMGAYEWTAGPVTVGDIASALRVAAGLAAPDATTFDRLNVDATSDHRIDISDAIRLARNLGVGSGS